MKQKNYEEKTFFGQDYDFFTNFLSKYVEYIQEDSITENININVTPEDKECFYNLMIEYEYSKNSLDKNESEMLADSLAFYISTGLIVKNVISGFQINLSLLKKASEKYEKAKEEGKTYSKGAIQ